MFVSHGFSREDGPELFLKFTTKDHVSHHPDLTQSHVNSVQVLLENLTNSITITKKGNETSESVKMTIKIPKNVVVV